MLKSEERLLVIGSGPCAFASLTSLLPLEIKIDICIGSFRKTKLSAQSSHQPRLKLAKRMTERSNIGTEYPNGPRLYQDGTAIRTSFNPGGLSLVWGGALPPDWDPSEVTWSNLMQGLRAELDLLSQHMPISKIRSSIKSSINCVANTPEIPVSKRVDEIYSLLSKKCEISFGISSLSLNQFRQIESETKDNIKPQSYGREIWRANVHEIAKSNQNKSRLLENCRVIQLNEFESLDGIRVRVTFQNDDGTFFVQVYKQVFVAAGCVESFRILATSNLCRNVTTMFETQIKYVPILDLSPRRILRSVLNYRIEQVRFSQLWFKGKSSNSSKYFLQLYELSKSLADSISGFKGSLLKILTPLIRHFVLVGILYTDSASSPRIDLIATDSGVESKLNNKGRIKDQRLKFEILTKIMKVKLLCLFPFSLNGAPGESAHFGAWAPMGKTTDYLGRFHPNSNIHLVDASVLPEILPGPITLFAMANASRISRQTFLD
jgi:hypothetical protein